MSDYRSRSNTMHVPYTTPAVAQQNRNYGNTVDRMKKNLYETSRQISRYKQLNKTGSLASRLNRALPANTNFPDSDLREKMTATGLETSKKFKMTNANNMPAMNMNSQQFYQDNQGEFYVSQAMANEVNARGAGLNAYQTP